MNVKLVVVAAICAGALGVLSPAAAEVVYSFDGSDINYQPPTFSTNQAGIYELTFSSSTNLNFDATNILFTHYDVFLAPPPKPHSEFLYGTNNSYFSHHDTFGTILDYTFTLPETEITYYAAGNEFLYQGVQPGTPVYGEMKYEGASVFFLVSPINSDPYDFTVTITRRDLPPPGTPVPEPATWALMVLGLGAMGSMLRRRRGDCAA